MTSELDPGISRRLGQFVSACSVLAITFGLWVLTGWMLHIQILKTILPGQVAVKANTAICFILIGVALWVLRKGPPSGVASWRLAAKIAAVFVSVVGLLSLSEFLWGWDLGIDQLVFFAGPSDIAGSVRPGLMSPITAFGLLALGPALLLLDAKTRFGRWSAQLLCAGVAMVSLFGVLDFVLDPISTHTHISPVTASTLFLLSFALMFSRTQSGLGLLVASASWGGTLTRRLLPAAILVPLVVAWLRWKGQTSGLYSDWAGVALMTVFTVTVLAGLAVWTGLVAERTDGARREGEEAYARLAFIVTSSNDAIIAQTLDGVVVSWNPGAEAIYGYSAQEMIGKSISIVVPPDRREEFATIMSSIRDGKRVGQFETTRLCKDGKIIDVSMSVSPLKDKTGTIIGASTIARDISERKRAQEALRTASLYTRSLIEASLDPLVTISREGKITDVNQATENVTGVTRQRLIGSDFCDYFTEPEKARQGYQQVFAQGSVQDYPLVIRHISGRLTDVLYNASVFKNEAGEIEGVFAAARDITEKKRAQETVAAEREKFNSILDVLPSYVVLLTPDYHVAFANREFRKRFGESNGRRCYEFLFGRTEPCEICETYKVLQTKQPLGWEWTGPDGCDYEIHDFPFTDSDGTTLILEMGLDVTERKRAERELQKASLYSRSLLEASLDPLVTISREGKITDVNAATEKVTGMGRERLSGSDFCSYFTRPAEARKGYERVFAEGSVCGYPLAVQHASGALTHVLYNATVFKNERGEIEEIFAAARDITDRVLAEQEVRQLNQELEARVAARTAELLALNKELESFTYAVAHDLRAPLRHIQGFSDLLLHDGASTLSPDAQHWLDCVLNGTGRMGKLLEDLLNLSRLGRQTLNRRMVPLKTLVQEVIDDLAPETANRLIDWKLGDLPIADCDPALMRIVFVNLLSNAVKFTRPRSTATVEIGQEMLNGEPVLFVRDNGAGFDMKYVGKLFGVFQRLHLEKDFEGTGIGLATVQRILLKHGGRIWAEAEVDKGATFYFTFGGAAAGLYSGHFLRVLPAIRLHPHKHKRPDLQVVHAGGGERLFSKPQLHAIPLLPLKAAAYGEEGDKRLDFDGVLPQGLIAAPSDWAPNPAFTSCLRVRGNSMAPVLCDGYIIVVDTSETDHAHLRDKMVVAWHPHKGITVSWLRVLPAGEALVSQSDQYKPVFLSREKGWKVIGRVIWWIGRDG